MERNKFGKYLNKVRKGRGLTAEKLAEICNINTVYLQQIEGGKKTPSLPVFISLCNALHISPDYLLQDDLEDNELTTIKELNTLWQQTNPEQLALILAIIKTVLTYNNPSSKL